MWHELATVQAAANFRSEGRKGTRYRVPFPAHCLNLIKEYESERSETVLLH